VLNQRVVQNTDPLPRSPLKKNGSSMQGNREPVDYLENERKREKEDDKRQRESQKEYLALMIMKLKMRWREFSNALKGSGVSSSMRLVFLDLRIVAHGSRLPKLTVRDKKWGKRSAPFARWEGTFKYKF